MKHFFYKYFRLIAIFSFMAVLFMPISLEARIPALAGIVSFAFMLEKQRLEELHLFNNLFKEFNKRYDELNENLNKIKLSNEELKGDDIDILYDYFNLCGEEYLYYKEGYLLPRVWEAWKNGMSFFFSDPKIKELWKKDCVADSYYGFDPYSKT